MSDTKKIDGKIATVHVIRKHGLDTFVVIVDRKVVASFMSEQAAKQRAYRINNTSWGK